MSLMHTRTLKTWGFPTFVMVLSLMLVALPARADTPPPTAPKAEVAPPPRSGVAVVTVVRARDLVSPAERQSYRQALRTARSVEERWRLRADLLERIGRRAAERGVVVVIESRAPGAWQRRNESWSTPHAAPPRAP